VLTPETCGRCGRFFTGGSIKTRLAIGLLTFSAVGLGGLVLREQYSDVAIIPTPNDRPTVGFGSTFREDGTPVRLGDTITPPRAIARTLAHIAQDEHGLKRCVTAPLNQDEYDVLVDFAYQYGAPRACASSMVREVNAGNYAAACRAYRLYKYSGGYDCSTPGNRICGGVWSASVKREAKCLAAQEPAS